MKLRTVRLNDYNSQDLGITFRDVIISGAEPKLMQIEVPYANGILDMTDIFGDVRYQNREIEMTFSIPYMEDHWAVYSRINNLYNGQITKITFSADPEYFWEGRVYVGELSCNEGRWMFSMTANVYPYKKKIEITTHTGVANEAGRVFHCMSGRMPVTPEIEARGPMTVQFGNITENIPKAGVYTFASIVFTEGDNVLTFTGGNTVIITYQEGNL